MSRIDIEPSWRDTAALGDALEVAPCALVGDHSVERIDTAIGAEFWGVYVHIKGQGVVWIADYDNSIDAVRFAERAERDFPNLSEIGIVKCWN